MTYGITKVTPSAARPYCLLLTCCELSTSYVAVRSANEHAFAERKSTYCFLLLRSFDHQLTLLGIVDVRLACWKLGQ